MAAYTVTELVQQLQDAHKFNVATIPASKVHELLEEIKLAAEGDRAALVYLLSRFDCETWQCPRCGHAEDTSDMDSAEYLRDHLNK